MRPRVSRPVQVDNILSYVAAQSDSIHFSALCVSLVHAFRLEEIPTQALQGLGTEDVYRFPNIHVEQAGEEEWGLLRKHIALPIFQNKQLHLGA